MKLSIVIICWNDLKVIKDCLVSIYAETGKIDFEVIISDNGSTDGSISYVREAFPQVRIVSNGANLGFAKGNNAGINAARGEYVLILNPDTIIHRGALDTLVSFGDRHPEAGAFGCRVLNPDGSYQHPAIPLPTLMGSFLGAFCVRWLGQFHSSLLANRYPGWDGRTERAIGRQSGCCILFRASTLEQIGIFDERFFYHYEEADLCCRMWKAGWKVLFCPDAEITHLGGQSVGRFPIRFALETYRSAYRYFYKHYGHEGAIRYRGILLLNLRLRAIGYRTLALFKANPSLNDRAQNVSYFHRMEQAARSPRLYCNRPGTRFGLRAHGASTTLRWRLFASSPWHIKIVGSCLAGRHRSRRTPVQNSDHMSSELYPRNLARSNEPIYCALHVTPREATQFDRGLFDILERLFPVEFRIAGKDLHDGGVEIALEDETGPRTLLPDVPSLTFTAGARCMKSCGVVRRLVTFSDHPEVPFPFRGRSLSSSMGGEFRVLSPSPRDKILATIEEGPVWLLSTDRGLKRFESGLPLPILPAESSLQEVLNGDRFVEVLPLLQWLRKISTNIAYDRPPLRACFMFDDPNLHWTRYGFVNFREIATRAAKENYHVSFATIPLDTWFTHNGTADIFRRNSRWLSLCVHGNNHTKAELAQNYSELGRKSLLRQANCRIERLERAANLRVCRIMVPPHGACSEAMLAAIARSSFEAACISHGSLRAHNKTKAWVRDLGYLPVEVIRGCPVLPRWGFAGNTRNTILLAAFLGQAIVLRGHHLDLKQGTELLDELAHFINGLGPVIWSNMTNISRRNYVSRTEGNTIRIAPLASKLMVHLAEEHAALLIEDPLPHREGNTWRISSNGAQMIARSGETIPIARRFQEPILIEVAPAPTAADGTPPASLSTTAVLRRFLTETRDRLLT